MAKFGHWRIISQRLTTGESSSLDHPWIPFMFNSKWLNFDTWHCSVLNVSPFFHTVVGFVGKVKNWSEKSPSCCYLNQGNTPGTVDFPVCFSMSGIKLIPTIEIWVVDPLLGSLGVLGVLWCTSFQDVRMWLLIDFVVLHFTIFSSPRTIRS